MLKKHSSFLNAILFFIDMVIVWGSWGAAYFLCFHITLFHVGNNPAFETHLSLVFFVILIYALVFRLAGLYKPMRMHKITDEIFSLCKASFLALFSVIIFIYFCRSQIHHSPDFFIFFLILNISFLSFFRGMLRVFLRELRRRGYNLRHILIVGSGDLAKEVALKIKSHFDLGLDIVGFLSHDKHQKGKDIAGIKVLGTYKDLKNLIKTTTIDQVIFALSAKEERMTRALLGLIDDEGIDIKVVPDFNLFYTLCKRIEDVDGLSVISLRDTPLYGWHAFLKRVVDIIFSLLVIIILLPLMLILALLIKISSEGPVFYTQKRVSLDGRVFEMIKFRTMKKDAEKETGAVWAKENDPRKTKIGAILRKTSLDELPQLFNVLNGDMSLVGPRPERPELVQEFLKHIPHYALRHKIKGGMTGWAQIHGWRGNTDLSTRIKYDLYYIERWSIWLDLQILLRTVPAVLESKGAY